MNYIVVLRTWSVEIEDYISMEFSGIRHKAVADAKKECKEAMKMFTSVSIYMQEEK